MLVYADDLKIFSKVSNISDAVNLQTDLDSIMLWASSNKLNINFDKCAILTFTRKHSPVLFDYKLSNYSINRVHEITDLGVTYSSQFDFSSHKYNITSRSCQLLSFIHRTTRDFFNLNSFIHLYESLVVPILTYGSCIWSPYTDVNSKLLEGVHHKLIRYLCFRSGEPMNFTDHIYERAISKFKIPPIKHLHNYHDCLLVFKVKNSITNCPDLSQLFTPRESHYNVRNLREFSNPCGSQNYIHFSSIPRMRRLWNSLPSDISSSRNICSFKSKIKLYLFKF